MPELRLLAFRPMTKNTLRGFADVRIDSGLIIKDVTVHTKNGKSWAGLPAKPQVTEGKIKTGDNGKALYVAILEWEDRDLSERFSAAVVKAIEAKFPAALA